MAGLKEYHVIFAVSAKEDMKSKARFIQYKYLDVDLAERWYTRLKDEIENGLSFLPGKYPVLSQGRWQGRGVHIFTVRSDIVLYEIDEDSAVVYIRNVFSRGKDLTQE